MFLSNIGLVRHALNNGAESISMARDSDDESGPVRGITQCLTKRGDVLGQAVFADEAVGPNELHELIFFQGQAA